MHKIRRNVCHSDEGLAHRDLWLSRVGTTRILSLEASEQSLTASVLPIHSFPPLPLLQSWLGRRWTGTSATSSGGTRGGGEDLRLANVSTARRCVWGAVAVRLQQQSSFNESYHLWLVICIRDWSPPSTWTVSLARSLEVMRNDLSNTRKESVCVLRSDLTGGGFQLLE